MLTAHARKRIGGPLAGLAQDSNSHALACHFFTHTKLQTLQGLRAGLGQRLCSCSSKDSRLGTRPVPHWAQLCPRKLCLTEGAKGKAPRVSSSAAFGACQESTSYDQVTQVARMHKRAPCASRASEAAGGVDWRTPQSVYRALVSMSMPHVEVYGLEKGLGIACPKNSSVLRWGPHLRRLVLLLLLPWRPGPRRFSRSDATLFYWQRLMNFLHGILKEAQFTGIPIGAKGVPAA